MSSTRWLAVPAFLLIVLMLIAVACTEEEDGDTETTPTPSAEDQAEETPAPQEVTPTPTEEPQPQIEEPESQSLQGAGQEVSDPVVLEEGLTIFRMTHDGASNFAIWLLNQETGEQLELLVNEIGSFDGAKAVGIVDPGNYVLDVSADGNWSVTAEQPRPADAPGPPQTFDGLGQSVSAPFTLNEGLASFTLFHDGSSNFAIWLIDAQGNLVELLVNEIGPFDGSKAVSVTDDLLAASPGIHFLDIAADGNWTVTVEQ